MTWLARAWREHRLALTILAMGTAVALFFAVRLALFVVYWADPAHRQQSPEGWMTPGYVARSWQVPRADVAGFLGLQPDGGRPPTLAEIAAVRGEPLPALLAELQTFLAARAER